MLDIRPLDRVGYRRLLRILLAASSNRVYQFLNCVTAIGFHHFLRLQRRDMRLVNAALPFAHSLSGDAHCIRYLPLRYSPNSAQFTQRKSIALFYHSEGLHPLV